MVVHVNYSSRLDNWMTCGLRQPSFEANIQSRKENLIVR